MNPIQTVPTAAASTTHPLILVAAAAVTIASGVVIANLAGWLPKSDIPVAPVVATVATAPVTVAVPEAVTPPTAAAVPAPAVQTPKPVKHVVPPAQKVGAGETAPQPMSRLPPPPPRAQAAMASSSSNVPPPGSAPGGYTVSSPVNAASVPPDYAPPPPPPAPAICRDCGTVESIAEVAVEGKGSPVGAIAGGLVGGIIGNQFGSGGSRTATRLLGAAGGAYIGNQVEKSNNKSVRYDMVVRFEDGTTRRFSSTTIPSWRIGDRVKLQDGQLFARG